MSRLAIKRGLLLFWAIWLSVVLLTNVADALKGAHIISATFPMVSGNFPLIGATIGNFGLGEPVAWILFVGVIVWEAIAAFLLWRAVSQYRGQALPGTSSADTALGVSLGLWAAFLISDEIFIAYPLESSHIHLLTAQLATLLVLHLIPD
jgi:hypothetical protein